MDEIVADPQEIIKFERVLAELDVYAGEDNVLGLTELGIGLEAVGDNIIVLVDSYRSGYECTTCKGTGKLRMISRCACDPDISDAELATTVGVPRGCRNRFGAPCESCNFDYQSKRIDRTVDCHACKGKGATLIIPDRAQSLPTTGVILSVGPDVTRGGIAVNKRVVATPHSGVFLPVMGNIPVRVYRQHEPLCIMYNIKKDGSANKKDPGELASAKFVELDVPLGTQFNT